MGLELLKILVQPVVLERDADGAITGERVGETTALYTRAEVEKFLDNLEAQIKRENGKHDKADLQ